MNVDCRSSPTTVQSKAPSGPDAYPSTDICIHSITLFSLIVASSGRGAARRVSGQSHRHPEVGADERISTGPSRSGGSDLEGGEVPAVVGGRGVAEGDSGAGVGD